MKKETYIKIANNIGVTHSAVSQWFAGKTKPTLEKALKMQCLYSIPVEAWLDIKTYIENNTECADTSTTTNKN